MQILGMNNQEETANIESAVISGTTRNLFYAVISISIRAIDNMELKSPLSNKVGVLPGFHKIAVEYVLINNAFKESTNVDLSFTAEAGREYKIKEDKSLIVIETTTGEVVASHPLSYKPSGLKPPLPL